MKRKVLFIILVLVIAIFAYLVYSTPKFIRINSFVCKSQYGSCGFELSDKLSGFTNRNYKEAKTEISKVLSEDVTIEKYLIKFQLPAIIKVEVVERKGMHAMNVPGSPAIFIVNDEGKILSKSETTGLPILTVNNGVFKPGDEVASDIKFALEVLFDMNYLYKVNNAIFDNGNITFTLEEGIDVIFPSSGEKEVLVGGLVLLYSQLKQDSENTRMKDVQKPFAIDMRYRNPVIRKK